MAYHGLGSNGLFRGMQAGLARWLQVAVSGLNATFNTLIVNTLTVNSGANLPAFDILTVNDGGTSSLATVISGVWNGSVITEPFGGTGQSSYAAGDVLFGDGVDSLATLSSGIEGQLLSIDGGALAWANLGKPQPSGVDVALLPQIPAVAVSGQSTEWLQIQTDLGTRYIPVWG